MLRMYKMKAIADKNLTGGIEMTDSEFYALAASSKPTAHRALFDEYCGYVYAVAVNKLRSCGSREDIEECVSDSFAAVYKALDTSAERGSELKGLISVIAKRTAISFYRRLSVHSDTAVSIDDENAAPLRSDENVVEAAESDERRRIVMQAVKDLGESDSTIIVQQYFYNRTAKDIGKQVAMTSAAVQKRSSRARQKLKALLLEAGISV